MIRVIKVVWSLFVFFIITLFFYEKIMECNDIEYQKCLMKFEEIGTIIEISDGEKAEVFYTIGVFIEFYHTNKIFQKNLLFKTYQELQEHKGSLQHSISRNNMLCNIKSKYPIEFETKFKILILKTFYLLLITPIIYYIIIIITNTH
jgi:hypothetical protein